MEAPTTAIGLVAASALLFDFESEPSNHLYILGQVSFMTKWDNAIIG